MQHYHVVLDVSMVVCVSCVVAVIPLMALVGAAVALTVSQFTRQHSDSWRLCIAMPVMPALVMLLSLMFVPESPWWLLAHKSPAGAVFLTHASDGI
jgi:hypothetical protein